MSPMKNESISMPVAIPYVQVGWKLPNHEANHQPVCFQKWTWHGACLNSSLLPFVLKFAPKNLGRNVLRFNFLFFLLFSISPRVFLCLIHNARRSKHELKWASSWLKLPGLHGEMDLFTGHSAHEEESWHRILRTYLGSVRRWWTAFKSRAF